MWVSSFDFLWIQTLFLWYLEKPVLSRMINWRLLLIFFTVAIFMTCPYIEKLVQLVAFYSPFSLLTTSLEIIVESYGCRGLFSVYLVN